MIGGCSFVVWNASFLLRNRKKGQMALEHRLGLALALFLIPFKILNESSLAEGVSVAVLDSWPEM